MRFNDFLGSLKALDRVTVICVTALGAMRIDEQSVYGWLCDTKLNLQEKYVVSTFIFAGDIYAVIQDEPNVICVSKRIAKAVTNANRQLMNDLKEKTY